MLQQFQLPPRPPFPRKVNTHSSDEPASTKPPGGNNKCNGHKKSFSQGSVLEDQPAWLEDLLSDSDSNTQRVFHCRSSSDPMASNSLHDLVPEAMHHPLDNDSESSSTKRSGGGALESACTFGPNSPTRRVNVEFVGNSVLAALSRHDIQMALTFCEEDCESHGPRCFDSWGGGFGSSNSLNTEQIEGKRHPRQRSRVRKLQYIAELDRTVNDLQVLVSELQHKISSLIQQHLTLSTENKKLKQQVSKRQHQKLVLESKPSTPFDNTSAIACPSTHSQKKALMNPMLRLNHAKVADDSWEMLNRGKLNFG